MSWQDIERFVPRTGRILTEDNRIVNLADLSELERDGFTSFNEKRFSQRNVLFSLSSIYPLSKFRDLSSGSVIHDVDEYRIEPGGVLESARRGTYVPGYEANVGIGFRFDKAAGAEAEWGYYDDVNGFLYRYTQANGLQAVFRRDSVDTPINSVDFNVDKLDGTGPSGIDLNSSANEGFVFELTFTWYGYGSIVWQILDKSLNGASSKPRIYDVHYESVESGTSTRNSNLPITVKNIGSVGNCHVSGRQFSLVGKFPIDPRRTGITSNIITAENTWKPVVSFRRKVGFNSYTISVDNINIGNLGNSIIEFQLILDPTLTGASPVQPDNRNTIETSVEFDKSATAFTDGEMFYSDVLLAGGNSKVKSTAQDKELGKPIPRDFWVTLIARTVVATETSDVIAHLSAKEDW